MRVTRTPSLLELRSTPWGFWLFSLTFVAGGLFTLYVLSVDGGRLSTRDQVLVALVGIGVAAGGLYSLATTLRTRLRCDLVRGTVSYEQWAPFRRGRAVELRRGDVEGILIRRDHDSDGDPWFVLELHAAGVPPMTLASAAQHGREGLERTRREIGAALSLPEAVSGAVAPANPPAAGPWRTR